MGLIAIAANPASGKDIRRLVSHAFVVDNQEKKNIVERIILAAAKTGSHEICIMPDSYGFYSRITKHLVHDLEVLSPGIISVCDMPHTESDRDTTEFARRMEERAADVLVVLGGDGTSRAAAKGIRDTPMISVSTGTNNVFPKMVEGTVVGLAASALASGQVKTEECCRRCKRIEVRKNGELADIALVDAVFSSQAIVGSKALWCRDDIERIVVTQCHPATIGFSAIVGSHCIVSAEEEWGAVAELSDEAPNMKVAMAAGIIEPFCVTNVSKLGMTQQYCVTADGRGCIALDGERELLYTKGDQLCLRISRRGPLLVDLDQALVLAQRNCFFRIDKPDNKAPKEENSYVQTFFS